MRTRRRSAVVVSVVLALTAWLLPASAEASGSAHRADVAAAEGYDFHTLTSADVIAATPGNIVIRYTAGRAIDDGVLRILVPRKSLPTDLHPVDALYETTPPGAFSVRPAAPSPGELLSEPTRPSDAMCEPMGPDTWDVTEVPGAQLITIRQIDCAAGRELAIRLEGVQAPERPGTYAWPLVMTARGMLPRLSVATVRVVRPPTTRLVVTVPSQVQADVPFDVLVMAVGPDGRPAVGYRGAVAITDPGDCTLVPRGRGVAHQFTTSDRGFAVISVRLDLIKVHQLRVYDIARRAIDGVSAPFEVTGPPPEAIICPVSYH
jgi:hypothetical protein